MLPRPIPAAGLEAYEAEKQACLLDPRKAENYEIFKSGGDCLPVKLDIENVSRCNFACTMCAVSKWPKGKRAKDMSLEDFKSLIDEQYGLVEIKLNWIGEPLMQGDDYFEMIRYARSKRIWVRMTTNASLLHLKDNYNKLLESGVNEIDISVDGADAPTFEGIRIQSDFNRVQENCKLLNNYASLIGKPSAKMWTLVQRGNAHNLMAHVDLASRLGFRHLVFSLQLHGWGDEKFAGRNKDEMVDLPAGHLQALVERGYEVGVRVSFWDVSSKFDKDNLCPWPFSRAVVTSDLRTVPCCMIGDPDKFEIGKGLSFMKAWKSDEYRDFRASHLAGKIPEVCRSCYK